MNDTEYTYNNKTYPKRMLPTLPRFEPTVADHSRIKVFKECPRKYFYRMILGRSAPEGKWASVFAWGTAIHKYLEVLYQTNGDAGEAAQKALPLWKYPTNPTFEFQSKERLMSNFAALFKFYSDEKATGNIETLAIEQPWNLVFPDSVPVGGRFDQVIKWNTRIWLRDWKTTSKQLQYWKTGLSPNDQATRYIYGLSALQFGIDDRGYPLRLVEGVIFVAIYNAKSVGPTIQPVPESRTTTQVRAWVDEQMFIHRAMEVCRETDTWPMHENNCGFCEYRLVCNAPSPGAMEHMLKNQFVLSPWKHDEVDQQTMKE